MHAIDFVKKISKFIKSYKAINYINAKFEKKNSYLT